MSVDLREQPILKRARLEIYGVVQGVGFRPFVYAAAKKFNLKGFVGNASGGETGHAKAVKITYDPSQISYKQLLKVFFAVAHDPTELNRQ